jgi:nickel/cobalt transporter (NicO) family protein
MPDIASLIQQGAVNLWIFIPTAIALGALHGLEPGHSKTMMAALIVAIRGTVKQAALLGLAATISHTAVVWLVAVVGMYFLGGTFNAETTEPYFQLASGIIIILIALWMMHRTWKHAHNHDHDHDHDHDHHHDHDHDHHHSHENSEYQDAHALAHANDIRRRFANTQNVTTGQIVLFGLTGGLIPCPASITILLLCLQLKQVTLGATLVFCFSIGLALTLVMSGVIAALSVRQVTKRWSGFGAIAHKAPYFSGSIIILIGVYVSIHGIMALN